MRGQSVILKPVGALGQQWSEAVGAQLGLISVLTEAAHRFMHRDAAHDSEDQQAKVVILDRMHYAHIHSTGVNKKHEKFIFEYRVFSQKLYLNMWCFEKVHICIPNMR